MSRKRTEQQTQDLVREIYRKGGHDLVDIVQILPKDGSWDTGLTFEVLKRDGTTVIVKRADVDDRFVDSIKD